MRIGDAERAAVTDRLAWHFSHGRLDQAELDDRLDQAMRAKTAADLTGLLADLPADGPTPPAPDARQHRLAELEAERRRIERERRDIRRAGRGRGRSGLRVIVLFVVMIVGVVAVAHALTDSVLVWIAVGLIAFLLLRHHDRTQRLAASSSARHPPPGLQRDDPIDSGAADQQPLFGTGG